MKTTPVGPTIPLDPDTAPIIGYVDDRLRMCCPDCTPLRDGPLHADSDPAYVPRPCAKCGKLLVAPANN
jgi:hypothetical protein